MAVSSRLAPEAPSVHRMKFGSTNLNGALTSISERVHLDEIAVNLERRGRAERLDVARARRLIACRSLMAPI
jgi:hypothetical protein